MKEPSSQSSTKNNFAVRWFRKVWKVRGGGLYAVGYAISFVVLETRTITGEILESDSVGEFVTSQLTEFLFRFAGQSLANFIKALMWPVYVIQWHPVVGGIALGLAFIVFDRVLRKPITAWLSADD